MPASGATVISILLWLKQSRTLALAESSGRTESKGWAKCLEKGYVRINADGTVTATEAGGDYLAEEMMYS